MSMVSFIKHIETNLALVFCLIFSTLVGLQKYKIKRGKFDFAGLTFPRHLDFDNSYDHKYQHWDILMLFAQHAHVARARPNFGP